MLNEWQEFLDYTGPMTYKADGKKDTTWLGRFTFEALRDFGGLSRILTILARGFLFHGPDGTVLDGQPRERMDYACWGLCAWCSVPERAGAQPEWQYRTDFGSLHGEFPALVGEDSRGWFCRHFHAAMAFARDNPEVVRKAYSEANGELDKKFDAEWRKKVRQFQMPLFSSNADAAWIIRFDDVIADGLELGPLRQGELGLPEELRARIEAVRPDKLPAERGEGLNRFRFSPSFSTEATAWSITPHSTFCPKLWPSAHNRRLRTKHHASFCSWQSNSTKSRLGWQPQASTEVRGKDTVSCVRIHGRKGFCFYLCYAH